MSYALELGADNGPAADLAGHFIVTRADSLTRRAHSYSPLGGLERIANSTALRITLKRRRPTRWYVTPCCRFMPIEVRPKT